jgi:hypothetical protein
MDFVVDQQLDAIPLREPFDSPLAMLYVRVTSSLVTPV